MALARVRRCWCARFLSASFIGALSASLSLPAPALALRPANVRDAAGLEEDLARTLGHPAAGLEEPKTLGEWETTESSGLEESSAFSVLPPYDPTLRDRTVQHNKVGPRYFGTGQADFRGQVGSQALSEDLARFVLNFIRERLLTTGRANRDRTLKSYLRFLTGERQGRTAEEADRIGLDRIRQHVRHDRYQALGAYGTADGRQERISLATELLEDARRAIAEGRSDADAVEFLANTLVHELNHVLDERYHRLDDLIGRIQSAPGLSPEERTRREDHVREMSAIGRTANVFRSVYASDPAQPVGGVFIYGYENSARSRVSYGTEAFPYQPPPDAYDGVPQDARGAPHPWTIYRRQLERMLETTASAGMEEVHPGEGIPAHRDLRYTPITVAESVPGPEGTGSTHPAAGMEEPKTLGEWETTDPGAHDPKKFRYVVHAFATEFQSQHLRFFRRGLALQGMALEPPADPFQNLKAFLKRTRISTSVIDQDHQATWAGSGIILRVDQANVVQASPQDAGTIPWSEPGMRPVESPPSFEKILQETNPTAYNEVVVGDAEGHPLKIVGVFIKYDERGVPIGRNKDVQGVPGPTKAGALAERLEVPVIALRPPPIPDKPVTVEMRDGLPPAMTMAAEGTSHTFYVPRVDGTSGIPFWAFLGTSYRRPMRQEEVEFFLSRVAETIRTSPDPRLTEVYHSALDWLSSEKARRMGYTPITVAESVPGPEGTGSTHPAAGLEEPVGQALAAGQTVVFEGGLAQLAGQAVSAPAELRAIRDEWFQPGRWTSVIRFQEPAPSVDGVLVYDRVGLPEDTVQALKAAGVIYVSLKEFSVEEIQREIPGLTTPYVLLADPETARALQGLANGVVVGIDPQSSLVTTASQWHQLAQLMDLAMRRQAEAPLTLEAALGTYRGQRVLLIAA